MKTKDVDLPTAADVMVVRVETLSPDTSIADAVDTLLARGVSGVPVVDSDGRPLGVLSEHDCVRVLVHSLYEDWPTGTVADHMTDTLETVEEHTDVIALAQHFAEGRHRRLLVVRQGKLVGLITRRDLMRALNQFRERVDNNPDPKTYELIQARRVKLGWP